MHDIFKQCAEIETSKFWKQIFEKASVGKFSPGYAFKDGIISCKNGNKMRDMNVSSDPELALMTCKEFFNQNSAMMSPEDKIAEMRRENERVEPAKENRVWTEIKANLRSTYIHEFVCRMTDEHSLIVNAEEGVNEVDALHSFIHYHMLLKHIKMTDFLFKDNRIESIQGITFDPHDRLWHCSKAQNKTKKPKEDWNDPKTDAYWSPTPILTDLDVSFNKTIEILFKAKMSAKYIPTATTSSSVC
jgi:hypothetical protein